MKTTPHTYGSQWIIIAIILVFIIATIMSGCTTTKPNPAGLRYEKKTVPTVGCVNTNKFRIKNNKIR